ncbi:hypothetical protein BDZ90DRAFT_257058 [Jaminaea rosea]|uniref:Redoxin domain-containing protein n=1 Tax=Jaminaea rosea TaxID=1569628 RepID=A0A316UY71_9BASI|nr:hypothetical protein BDZ90DRAFT_257058 [Jaminaea rosea]PWN29944.1 hypothetical protein BDZ90DRAFT_257058 [Jaminaea rosea]
MASHAASSSSAPLPSGTNSNNNSAASHGLSLPSNLPVPENDGGTIHLVGHPLPACAPLRVIHPSSSSPSECEEDGEGEVDLFMRSITHPERDILLFVYPHTGKPNAPPGNGWDEIAGARGCTPELVGVREGLTALRRERKGGNDVMIYGMSGDDQEWQREVSGRLGLNFPLLSSHPASSHQFSKALDLPTFEHQGNTYLKRCTLLIREGQVVRCDYPVFPPDAAWRRVVEQRWLDEEGQ